MKQRILFAMIMGLITTALVSFTLLYINRGISPGFVPVWMKSWMISYFVVIPIILLVGPKVQGLVSYLFKENTSLKTSS